MADSYSPEERARALELLARRRRTVGNDPGYTTASVCADLRTEFGRAPHGDTLLAWAAQERNAPPPEIAGGDPLEVAIHELRRKKKKFPETLEDLCDAVGAPPGKVRAAVKALEDKGVLVELTDSGALHAPATPPPETLPAELTPTSIAEGKHLVSFAATSDWHIGHQCARRDVVEALYDECQRRGVSDVYLAGNYIEGVSRFNRHELEAGAHTLDGQVSMFLGACPARPGITTHIVSGDDHEGWWAKSAGMDIGRHVELRARDIDRADIINLGYQERDVVYRCPDGDMVVRVAHPGGGSAYALSYAPQKIAESYQGGEKPEVLLIGHYHKAEYLPAYRNMHVVQTGACCDQTSFMRKRKLQSHVGAWIVEIVLDDAGLIRSFTPSFYPFFDRGFYVSRRVEVVTGEVRRLVPARAWGPTG